MTVCYKDGHRVWRGRRYDDGTDLRPCPTTLAAALFSLSTGVATASASPPPIDPIAVIAFCRSPILQVAVRKGDALGWMHADAARLAQWRSAFVATQGGSVEVVGWSRGGGDHDDSLGFWVVGGDPSYNGCAYTTQHGIGELRDALVAAFGKPATRYVSDVMTVESWTSTHKEISFSQVSSTALVYIFTYP